MSLAVIRAAIFLFCIAMAGCNFQSAKFISSSSESTNNKIKKVYVIVLADVNSQGALKYYKAFLADSLKSNNVEADAVLHCCIEERTNMQELVGSLLPTEVYTEVLLVRVKRRVIGYGNTSSMELQLDLVDDESKSRWTGVMTCKFGWYISDQNYQDVAHKLTTTTLKELRKKGFL